MHADVVGHVAQHQGSEVGDPVVQEGPLMADDGLRDLVDGPLALIDALEQPERAPQFVLHVVPGLFGARLLLVQHSPVGGADAELGEPVVVEHDLVVVSLLHHEHVGEDVGRLVQAVAVAGLGVEALDDLEMVRHLVGGERHQAADLRVLMALELLQAVAHHHVRGRALEPEVLELQAQALGQGAGGHTRRVQGLDHRQRLVHLGPRVGPHVRDLLEGGAEQAVLVEVVDDRFSDLHGQLVGGRHVQLPEQVVVEIGGLREGVLDGRHLRHLGGPGAPLEATVVEVVLEELLDLDVLQGVVGLLPFLRHLLLLDLLRGQRLLDRYLLEERVLHHLLLQHLGQLEGGEGEQLDGLLERGGEDQALREARREPELLLHGQGLHLGQPGALSPVRRGGIPRRDRPDAPPGRRRARAAFRIETHCRP